MNEVLAKAKQTVKTAIEEEIARIMTKAVQGAKSAIADEALSECSDVLDAETLLESIVQACKTFDFEAFIVAVNQPAKEM